MGAPETSETERLPSAAIDPLDHPLWFTLTGLLSHYGSGHGQVRRFLPDVSTLAALGPGAGPEAWVDLHGLLAPGEYVALFFLDPAPSFPIDSALRVVYEGDYDQMVCTEVGPPAIPPRGKPALVPLSQADSTEMMALVELTEPGPFAERTHEVGRYVGIRTGDGQLVAMAGERSRLTGHIEISAVCTHPAHRGRGYADLLVRELCSGALAGGSAPFLHVRSDNHTARRAYERIGFTTRRKMKVIAVQRPRDK